MMLQLTQLRIPNVLSNRYLCMQVSNFIAMPCVLHLICLVRIFSFAANQLARLPTSSMVPCHVNWFMNDNSLTIVFES